MEEVQGLRSVSSVSGGSLAVGILFGLNNGKWPTSEQLQTLIENEVKETLVQVSIKNSVICKIVKMPWRLFSPWANIVSEVICEAWSLSQTLQDLPDRPEFRFNCTTYETGKNWRFSKEKMGDYLTGYFPKPKVRISDAITASAAYPGLIGPLRLKRPHEEAKPAIFESQKGQKTIPNLKAFWLWDGGVYENLGVESLYKNRELQKGLDFIIVSDASGPLGIEKRRWSWKRPFAISAFRLVNIAMDQTRALRARDIMSFITSDPTKGRYLYIRNTVPGIYERSKREIPTDIVVQNAEQVSFCSDYKTDLKALTRIDYDLLLARGYEVARATFDAYRE